VVTARELEAYLYNYNKFQQRGKEQTSLPEIHLSSYVLGKDFPVAFLNKTPEAKMRGVIPPKEEAPAQEVPLRSGKDYAVLFATDKYADPGWDSLSNPVYDAQTVAKELEENYKFEIEVVEGPTRDTILRKLLGYVKRKYGDDDQLFIFFAGHGIFDLGQGYVVAKDSRSDDEIRSTYLSHSDLRTLVNNIPCKHIFIVLDTCFGGAFDPKIGELKHRGEKDKSAQMPVPEFIKSKLLLRTRKYLSSGDKVYVPDGRPGQHSPFTRQLLEALRSYGGKDGVLTSTDLLGYMKRLQPDPRSDNFADFDPGSEFLFIAKWVAQGAGGSGNY
jgi:hypothetical protein